VQILRYGDASKIIFPKCDTPATFRPLDLERFDALSINYL